MVTVALMSCISIGCSPRHDTVWHAKRAIESDLQRWKEERERYDSHDLATVDQALLILDGKRDDDFKTPVVYHAGWIPDEVRNEPDSLGLLLEWFEYGWESRGVRISDDEGRTVAELRWSVSARYKHC
jgi:hypothetical protein